MLIKHLMDRERALYMSLIQKAAAAAKRNEGALPLLRKLGDAHEVYRDTMLALDKMAVDALGGVQQAAVKLAERAEKAKAAAQKRARGRKK